MATQGKVARRYAKALYDELKGGKKHSDADKILAELEIFSRIVDEHEELSKLIASPGFSPEQKTAVVTDIVAKLKLSKMASQIVTSISRMERISNFPGIVARLKAMILENEGIQPIQVFTADEMSAEDQKQIETRFTKLLGKKVEATYETVPSLIGGLRVVASGETYDGTVAGWLDSLRESLVEGDA